MTYNQPQQPQPGPWAASAPPQQPQYQPGPPPYGYQQPYGPPPQQPRKKSRAGLIAGLGCGGLALLVIIVIAAAAAGSHSSSSFSAPAVAPPQSAAAAAPAKSTAPAKAAAARTVATFTGSGEQKTAPFTTAANWAISYSFDCSSFGFKGNFQVDTDNGDGSTDFNGVTVNDLAMSKSAVTYAYNDAGTHFLDVNSECSWTVKVVSQG